MCLLWCCGFEILVRRLRYGTIKTVVLCRNVRLKRKGIPFFRLSYLTFREIFGTVLLYECIVFSRYPKSRKILKITNQLRCCRGSLNSERCYSLLEPTTLVYINRTDWEYQGFEVCSRRLSSVRLCPTYYLLLFPTFYTKF